MLINGKNLTPKQRSLVLAAFVRRWTVENAEQSFGGRCPACVQQKACGGAMEVNGKPFHEHHLALTTDEAWINTHAFYFLNDGSRLMENRDHAEPAYEEGPDNIKMNDRVGIGNGREGVVVAFGPPVQGVCVKLDSGGYEWVTYGNYIKR